MRRLFTLIFAFWVILQGGCSRTTIQNRPLVIPYTATDSATVINAQKAITSFVIKAADNPGLLSVDVSGSTTFDSVNLIFPPGTNLSNLIPTITIIGKSVSPASLIPQNFDSVLVYTVTATDGSSFSWKVASSLR
jgi:hypothetical protein